MPEETTPEDPTRATLTITRLPAGEFEDRVLAIANTAKSNLWHGMDGGTMPEDHMIVRAALAVLHLTITRDPMNEAALIAGLLALSFTPNDNDGPKRKRLLATPLDDPSAALAEAVRTNRRLAGLPPQLHRCAGPYCPGLTYRASQHGHPWTCVYGPRCEHCGRFCDAQCDGALDDDGATPMEEFSLERADGGYDGPGWYYWVSDYPSEGSVGAFETLEAAHLHCFERACDVADRAIDSVTEDELRATVSDECVASMSAVVSAVADLFASDDERSGGQ